jgi:hypothetical protein
MVRSGPRLLITLDLILFNLSSHKKFQPVLSSVQIPGKHTTVSRREDMSTVSSITPKNQYSDGKGDHIHGREGFRGYLERKLVSKGGIRREKVLLYLEEYVGRYNHRNENDNFNVKRIIKLPEHTV